MPAINAALLSCLEDRLGVGRKRVYALISQIANKSALEKNLAALVLAMQSGIGIHRYSSTEERAALRGANQDRPAPPPSNNLDKAEKRAQTKRLPPARAKKVPKTRENTVFVVHGRNEQLRKDFFDFLRALGLKPLEWSAALAAARGANPFIGDILDAAMEKVQAVVVLMSPDDEAKLKDEFCGRGEKSNEGKLQGQSRPNVLFEAGLALGRHPDKILLIQIGKIKTFSDIAGKHILRLSNTYDRRNDAANRLRKIGCKIDITGTDWTKAGNFDIK